MTFKWPFLARIVTPCACPSCGGSVFVPALKAYVYAAGTREHVGDVCECAACGCRVTLMHNGSVLRYRGATQQDGGMKPNVTSSRDPGGTETGRPGSLDTDLFDPTYAGPQ